MEFLWRLFFLPKHPLNLYSRQFEHPKNEQTWEDFEDEVEKKCPIRFYIVTFIERLFRSIWRFLCNIPYWIRTHTYNRYHIINVKQPKNSPYQYSYNWGWIDRCHVLPFAMFNILCDFVENEFMPQYWWEWNEKKQKSERVKKSERKSWKDLLKDKEKELNKEDFKLCDGSFDENNYEMTVHERKYDLELLTIYKWWKEDRFELCKKENDSLDEWMNYKDRLIEKNGGCWQDWSDEEKKHDRELMDRHLEAENNRLNQEEDMLIRIVKIRHGLWT
jgi:hypothetical protein